jgi:hypothetical protein
MLNSQIIVAGCFSTIVQYPGPFDRLAICQVCQETLTIDPGGVSPRWTHLKRIDAGMNSGRRNSEVND